MSRSFRAISPCSDSRYRRGDRLGSIKKAKAAERAAYPVSPVWRSARRAPGHHGLAIAGARLLDVGPSGERIVETLHHHLLGGQHVVELAARGVRHAGILVEHQVPARIAHE